MGDLLLVALFLGMVLWVGWPVTLWFVCAALVAVGARLGVRRARGPAWAQALADVLTGIAVGVGLVWLVQVVLTGIGGLAGAGAARSTETWIAAVQSAHARFTLPTVLVAGIALALLVWSRDAPKAAWALAATGAVLVFGGLTVRTAEVRWAESRRIEASSDLRSLRAAQTQLVAMAEVERRLGRLPDEDTSYLASFLRATESKKHRSEILAEKAGRLAAGVSEPAVTSRVGAATAEWEAVRRCAVWLKASSDERPARSPSLDDLDVLARVARDARGKASEGRRSMDALAGAVVDATATTWAPQEWGPELRDLASAERLVAADGAGQEGWDVVTRADGVKAPTRASAIAEVDALERDFEASEAGRGEWEWAH